MEIPGLSCIWACKSDHHEDHDNDKHEENRNDDVIDDDGEDDDGDDVANPGGKVMGSAVELGGYFAGKMILLKILFKSFLKLDLEFDFDLSWHILFRKENIVTAILIVITRLIQFIQWYSFGQKLWFMIHSW